MKRHRFDGSACMVNHEHGHACKRCMDCGYVEWPYRIACDENKRKQEADLRFDVAMGRAVVKDDYILYKLSSARV